MDNDITDVTSLLKELQKARETIRELEGRARTILDSVHAGIMIIDPESHRIVDVNPEASTLIGVPKEQIIGHVCHTFVCPAEMGNCPITDKGQKVDKSERILLTTDGRRIPILKTVAPIELNGRSHLLENFLDISGLKLLQKELEYFATTDPLTGAYNRRHFLELAEAEVVRARRYQCPLSISMIDIDQFKEINDRYGHPVGDLVLTELVKILEGRLRPNDIVGRLGGDEFAVMMVECDLEKALAAMARLRKSVEEYHILTDSGVELWFKISAGIAQLSDETEDLESVMRRADQALYLAKSQGRNRVEIAPPPFK
ncbi:MAG: diguanylate cyclase [Syntrophaceae bacterium]|nr:diguanylate cyclase [Syntrophaceae bacterium]